MILQTLLGLVCIISANAFIYLVGYLICKKFYPRKYGHADVVETWLAGFFILGMLTVLFLFGYNMTMN